MPTSTRRMARTRLRPTASGRIEPAEALAVGVTLAIISVMLMGLALNWLAAALLALDHRLLRLRLHDVAEAADAAEHRHRRRRRGSAADGGVGRGDRRDRSCCRCCCSRSSSCGRRRISGRWRSTGPATTTASACRCCRWSPVAAARLHHILAYTVLLVLVSLAASRLGPCRPRPTGPWRSGLGGVFLAYAVRLWRRGSRSAGDAHLPLLDLLPVPAVRRVRRRSRGAGSAAGLKMAMSENELRRRQRTKNVALAVGLLGSGGAVLPDHAGEDGGQ